MPSSNAKEFLGRFFVVSEVQDRFLAERATVESKLGEAVTISGLTGPLRIFQRVRGNRHSLDDTATAWYALQKRGDANSLLDLGSGVGCVGTIVLWGLNSAATMSCVEAQDGSFALLDANIRCNGLQDRVTTIHGDLRELLLTEKFDLVTASPPYFPAHAGILPKDSQKAHARFELRGDVGDYAHAAARHLAADGTFVFCFPTPQTKRGMALVEASGLRIYTARDVYPRAGRAPLFSLYSAGPCQSKHFVQEPPFIVADAQGIYTEEMRAMQGSRGFGPDGTNVIE